MIFYFALNLFRIDVLLDPDDFHPSFPERLPNGCERKLRCADLALDVRGFVVRRPPHGLRPQAEDHTLAYRRAREEVVHRRKMSRPCLS